MILLATLLLPLLGCISSPSGEMLNGTDHHSQARDCPYPLKVVGTEGACAATIQTSDGSASWTYRIPETLSCEEGVFKVFYHPTVTWSPPDEDGAIAYTWRTSAEDLHALATHPNARLFGDVFITGIRYRVTLRPACDGIAVRVDATNISDRTFHNVTVYPCLGHPDAPYQDPELQRTFIPTAAGLTPVGQLARGSVDPRRTHFRVEGEPAMPFVNTPFWGEPRPTRATRGVILRTRDDGRFTLATTWDRVIELFYNADSHHCIHAVASFGDLAPGASSVLHGRIVLMEGSPEQSLGVLDGGR